MFPNKLHKVSDVLSPVDGWNKTHEKKPIKYFTASVEFNSFSTNEIPKEDIDKHLIHNLVEEIFKADYVDFEKSSRLDNMTDIFNAKIAVIDNNSNTVYAPGSSFKYAGLEWSEEDIITALGKQFAERLI